MLINLDDYPIDPTENEIMELFCEMLQEPIEVAEDWNYLDENKDNYGILDNEHIIKLNLKKFHPKMVPYLNQLLHLKELDVTRTIVDTFPVDLFQHPGLEIIHFGINSMTSFPPFSHQNTTLRELHILANQLHTLPAEIENLHALEVLDLDGNQLNKFPKTLENLKLLTLELGHNQLISIPDEVFSLKQLKKLNLAGNLISKMNSLVYNLPNLQSLNISKNQFTDFPIEWSRIKTLNAVYAFGNPIPSNEVENWKKQGYYMG